MAGGGPPGVWFFSKDDVHASDPEYFCDCELNRCRLRPMNDKYPHRPLGYRRFI